MSSSIPGTTSSTQCCKNWVPRIYYATEVALLTVAMPGLVYAFVSRGTTVLAEYAALAGNFRTVAIECLQNSQEGNDKFIVTADQYTFNYLVQQGFSESPPPPSCTLPEHLAVASTCRT